MKEQINALIEERAKWLFANRPYIRAIRLFINTLLSYNATLDLAIEMQDWPSDKIMDRMGRLLAQRVNCTGLEHIPVSGPALIVSNHPTGIADGIILHRLLATKRPDTYFFANSDILRIMPQMEDIIAAVEWRTDRRTHAKTRSTMAYTKQAVDEGRLGVIFPSGRLAKRRGLRLYERQWMPSPVTFARKFDLPIIPVRIEARNSALFYLFDWVHPSLRDITLFHETLNKYRQHFCVHIGKPIAAKELPIKPEEAITMLYHKTLALKGTGREQDKTVPLLSKWHFSLARLPHITKVLRQRVYAGLQKVGLKVKSLM
ncbi:2-acyl-glycerophospho-ethanolamine acyltransferase [Nereida ignava]|uniref:2-acyl-glycerophospho-ethanolamine acyltransferase n=1 Tax=Nereida ignava TaxID=282199 RepID=A0A0U1NN04_9RHOB|nr:1-acyl-sn-glycerol-3-phosphate acyltransferase [Nereida ignava]CRK76106.1 2-acyl-glycerophospho-ethanolamine acyltransferase [Nereida ignava]SFJ85177.1 Putative hemolysin [Nereida ignava DSM 16309]